MSKQSNLDKRLVDAGFELDNTGPSGWASRKTLAMELDEIHSLPLGERIDALDDWGYRYMMAWAARSGADWGHTFDASTSAADRQAWFDAQPKAYRDASGLLEAYENTIKQNAPEDVMNDTFNALRASIVGWVDISDPTQN